MWDYSTSLINNWSPIKASERVSLVSWMLEQCSTLPDFNINAIYYNGSTLVHAACTSGSISLMKVLENYNINIDALDNDGESALHKAALSGSLSLFKYLVNYHHLDPSGKSYHGAIPLQYASQSGNVNIVDYLANISDINYQAPSGMAALHYSSRCGHYDIVYYLIEKQNINFYICDNNNKNALHHACYSGNMKLVQYLITKVDTSVIDNDGRSILHYAALGITCSLSLVKILVDQYQLSPHQVDQNGCLPFHNAAYKGHTAIVKYFIVDQAMDISVTIASNDGKSMLHDAAIGGSLSLVKLLVEKYQLSPHQVDQNGCLPLHDAADKGHTAIVEYFIVDQAMNTSVTSNDGKSILHHAALGGSLSLVKLLVEKYQLSPHQVDQNGLLPLHYAANKGHITIVEYFIVDQAVDTSVTSNDGKSILHHPALGGSLPLVKLLVEKYQLSPHQVDQKGLLPLHYAANQGHTAIVEYFIVDQAMDASVTSNDGKSILHHAALGGSLSLVKLLVEKYQFSPHQVDQKGLLPLHYAANKGHTAIVEYFIVDQAMDTSVTSNDGKSILHHAALGGSLSVVKLLVEKYQFSPHQVDQNGLLPLHNAADKGHTTIVEYFIVDQAMDTSVTSNDGSNILHYAALGGSLSLVKLLVDQYQLNLYQGGTQGHLPVHAAAQKGYTTIVTYFLVDKAMDASVTDNLGLTLLHQAAGSDNVSLVELLVDQYQLNPYQYDGVGQLVLPLHIAAQKGCTSVLKYFINQCHVKVPIQTANGYNIVHYATENGHYHTTEYLSTVYIDGFSVPDKNGVLPIHTACQSGNIQLVEYLVDEIGCDIRSLTNFSHQSCAAFACMSGNLDLLRLLATKYSLDLTVTDRDGFTLLHYAAEKGHNRIIEWLVEEHKLDPHSTSNNATTTLHKAASGGDANTVKYLYETYSLDVNSTTTTNKYTPLHSATVNGHIPVVQYLTKLPKCNVTTKDSDGSTVLHLSCKHGYVELLEHYMRNHTVLLENVNLYNSKDLSPLDVGCINGNLHVVKHLVEDSQFNKEIKGINVSKAFHCAFLGEHSEVMHYLFNKVNSALVPSCIAIKGINGNTPCHVACSSGNIDIVKSFTEAVINSNVNPLLLTETNDNGFNIFHFAAIKGSLPVIEHLVHVIGLAAAIIDAININHLLEAKTIEGHTPLYLSCITGHMEVVKSLATLCPSTISMVDNNGRGLMHAAAHSINVKLIDYLADEYKLEADASDKTGVTPLHIAAEIGNFIAFKALINCTGKSGNFNPVSHDGKTPFSLACENGHMLITSYLADDLKVSIDVSSTTYNYSPLHVAASNNKVATVQLLVEKFSVDVNCTFHDDNSTPLHLATIKGHVAVVLYLTRLSQCNVTATLTDGSTVLHLSSKHGHYHLVKHFVHVKNHKQLVKLSDNSNMTPLHYACREGHLSIVQCLVEQGHSDTAVQDNGGHTCYHHAVTRDHSDIVMYLVNLENSVVGLAMADNGTNTPLHIACSSDSLEMVKVLLDAVVIKKPSILSITNSSGCNIIHCASEKCNISIMEFLVDCMKSNNLLYLCETCNSLGQTPLHLSCVAGQVEVVKSLATLCPSTISMIDNNGRGLMHAAAQSTNVDVIKYLAEEHSFTSDTPDNDGETPLHIAAKGGTVACFRVLADYAKSSVNPMTQLSKRTPLHNACQAGKGDIAMFLVNRGISILDADKDGYTPVHMACMSGNKELVSQLLYRLNPTTFMKILKSGVSLLKCAAIGGNIEVVKILVEIWELNSGVARLLLLPGHNLGTN